MDTAARATDQRLALAALEKQRRGDMPNREEMAALKRFERARDEEARQKHLRTIRRGEWCLWAGRKPKAVLEHASRFGLPLAGETINVVALAPAIHDLLDGLAARPDSAEKPRSKGELTPLERKRLAEARRIEHQLQCELGRWVEREAVVRLLAAVGKHLRRTTELLSGIPEARKAFDLAVQECERAAQRLMSDEIRTSP
jgi:hypothetical protein